MPGLPGDNCMLGLIDGRFHLRQLQQTGNECHMKLLPYRNVVVDITGMIAYDLACVALHTPGMLLFER